MQKKVVQAKRLFWVKGKSPLVHPYTKQYVGLLAAQSQFYGVLYRFDQHNVMPVS